MGARQSKRSVDITTTPKKDGIEEQQPLDGHLEHIEEGGGDTKPALNGAPSHSTTDIQEELIHNGSEAVVESEIQKAAETPDAEVVTEEKDKSIVEETNTKTKKEKKEKPKKKWSFRSISFSKKDKSKPTCEDKNGDVSKDEVVEANEENVASSEAPATSSDAPATNSEVPAESSDVPSASSDAPAGEVPPVVKEGDGEVAKDSKETVKPEEVVVAAEVQTKTENIAPPSTTEHNEVQKPTEVEEPIKQQTQANVVEAAAPTSNTTVEEIPPPLPASPPPMDNAVETVKEVPPDSEAVTETVAQVEVTSSESIPAPLSEKVETADVPASDCQPASPVQTSKDEENVAKTEEPVAPVPVTEPKREEETVAEQVQSTVEKTEVPSEPVVENVIEPVPPVCNENEVVGDAPVPVEAPVQAEPIETSDVKTPDTQETIQASNETIESTDQQAAVEE